MNFSKLVPSVFYEDIYEGLTLFVDLPRIHNRARRIKRCTTFLCIRKGRGAKEFAIMDNQLGIRIQQW